MTGIILSGGKNTRIGFNKAFIKIDNITVIEIIINKLKKIFEEIIIVTNFPEEYQKFNVKVVKDIIPDKGPLGGLYSGLVNSKSQYSFVVACDMPFLNVELIEFIKNNCSEFDVIVPKHKNGYEPLHAIYSKDCIYHIEKQLGQDNLKITGFFKKVKLKEITEDIIKHFDPDLLSFFNINTKSDYEEVLRCFTKKQGLITTIKNDCN